MGIKKAGTRSTKGFAAFYSFFPTIHAKEKMARKKKLLRAKINKKISKPAWREALRAYLLLFFLIDFMQNDDKTRNREYCYFSMCCFSYLVIFNDTNRFLPKYRDCTITIPMLECAQVKRDAANKQGREEMVKGQARVTWSLITEYRGCECDAIKRGNVPTV